MFNLQDQLKRFYDDHVRLGRDRRKALADFRDNSIVRLNNGLDKLGEQNNRTYPHPVEFRNQGGYAMHTLNQARGNEYDIDTALIFNRDDLPDGAAASRRRIRDAFIINGGQFKEDPSARQNAVTIWYASGQHLDFAIYRKYKDYAGRTIIEHAGGEDWSERDPDRTTNWFTERVTALSPKISAGATVGDGQLRRIVRFIKYFNRSRVGWRLPGGMITTALVVECYKPDPAYDDVSLFRTIEALQLRLAVFKAVASPIDGSNLTQKQKRLDEVVELFNKLSELMPSLRVLDDPKCTRTQARAAWRQFFNHEFWNAENDTASKGLLETATAASISPLAFPGTPRVPSKPKGFA